MVDQMEPIKLDDVKKKIVVPRKNFEAILEELDWTWQQIARNELPGTFTSLEEFQIAIICDDPFLWCTAFLREPEDPNHQDPYNFFDYQLDSLKYDGNTIHKCGAEVGKTREINAWIMYRMFTRPNGSGMVGAPMQIHLQEIIESIEEQMEWNPDLAGSLKKRIKHPHHAFYLKNGFKLFFRPSGHDGEAYRGVHVRDFAIKDEAAKDKNPKQWTEFWRAMKPGCVSKIYSVPDGDRSCEFYKLAQRAQAQAGGKADDSDGEVLKGTASHIKNLEFKIFHWPKTVMPDPFWSPERRKFFIDQYGGEDSPGYRHNVMGEDGDPENTVFPWNQFQHCIRDIPEYRALKILVNSGTAEVSVAGYRCEYNLVDGAPVPGDVELMDTVYPMADFFDLDENNESTFTRLIKRFFIAVPGAKRGGGDFGFSGDPTEILVKNIIGKRERLVARLNLKHVTYDAQCQAINALDDVYGPTESLQWGTDFGNAGSAVAHDLQGLALYLEKEYDCRLKGFMFESTTENVNEDGDALIDAKTGKPARITLKELGTDLLVKKMQRLELEYPPDSDIILYYTNHTVRAGSRHRIYKKEDDHLLDADRVQILAKVMGNTVEDLFA